MLVRPIVLDANILIRDVIGQRVPAGCGGVKLLLYKNLPKLQPAGLAGARPACTIVAAQK